LHDYLNDTLPSTESIIEAMYVLDRPWDDLHHRSYFLLDLEWIGQDDFRSTLSEMAEHDVVLLDTHGIYVEGKMKNIYPTIMIDISRTPDKIENLYVGADCAPREIHIYNDLFNKF
jgi:hypothetical protein